jgi:nucleoside-diphosphate-sugar epimerase
MKTANDVLNADLEHLAGQLRGEFARMAGKRLLITGGAGFLGYYLVQVALDWNRRAAKGDGITLTVYDNFFRGVPEWLEALARTEKFDLVRHDMIQPLPANAGPWEFVIHAAGVASPIYYRRFPLETIDANINGLRNLLDLGRRQQDAGTPLEGFLFYSSSEIYGDPTPENIPTPETYRGNVSCTGPRACYDESKRFGETLCVIYAQQYGLPISMARPFNNYGPGLKITDGRVIPDIARDIFAGRDIVLKSDGGPKRTFCYVADAVAGYYKVLVRGRAGEPYNVGVETPEISVRDLAERLQVQARTLFDYRGQIVSRASEEAAYLVDNPVRRCPDIQKARTELDYDPQIMIDEGLRRSLLWYSGNREGSEA